MPQVAAQELEGFLQQPRKVQQAYSMLCSPALLTGASSSLAASTGTLSPAGYLSGLQAGAAIQRLGVAMDTQNQRDKAMQELTAWLSNSVGCRGLHDCIPEDIIVYLVTWWAQTHGGCQAPDGSFFAAPVSLEAICSHLAVEFDKQGRTGDWDCLAGTGEPLLSLYLGHAVTCQYSPGLLTNQVVCRQPNEEHTLTTIQKGVQETCS